MRKSKIESALFIGCFPTGIGYADQRVEEHGDWKTIAFLPFSTLELEVRVPKSDLLPEIRESAAAIIARRGEQYPVDASGHTITLGGGQ